MGLYLSERIEPFYQRKDFLFGLPNVGGLVKTKPVYINGVKIGQVSKVYFDPRLNGKIIVELSIVEEFPIPRNSVARIFSEDLMGSRAIDIILGNSGNSLKAAIPSSPIPKLP